MIAVCTENLIRIDWLTESPNVRDNVRAGYVIFAVLVVPRIWKDEITVRPFVPTN